MFNYFNLCIKYCIYISLYTVHAILIFFEFLLRVINSSLNRNLDSSDDSLYRNVV